MSFTFLFNKYLAISEPKNPLPPIIICLFKIYLLSLTLAINIVPKMITTRPVNLKNLNPL